jgi:ribonuclease-3
VTAELGPPHDRTFEVRASVNDTELGTGRGRSKKHAEQEAARVALDALEPTDAEA